MLVSSLGKICYITFLWWKYFLITSGFFYLVWHASISIFVCKSCYHISAFR
jgi:hypothetical protein